MNDDCITERFWSKADQSGGEHACWPWVAGRTSHGYGAFSIGPATSRRTVPAHRVAWEIAHGAIPSRTVVDHHCRNRACVNPTHMELVTPAENARRAAADRFGRDRYAPITSCPSGHPYTPENTVITKQGWKKCRECARQWHRDHPRKKERAA